MSQSDSRFRLFGFNARCFENEIDLAVGVGRDAAVGLIALRDLRDRLDALDKGFDIAVRRFLQLVGALCLELLHAVVELHGAVAQLGDTAEQGRGAFLQGADAEVEVHFKPIYLNNPFLNRRLNRWYDAQREEQMSHRVEMAGKLVAVPTLRFNALYQQHPTIEGGNIVKRDWFRKISMAEFKALRFNEPMHFYLDTAYNKKKNKGQDNDPSGILAACRIGTNIYLYDAMQMWKEMPDLLRFLPEYIAAHEGDRESKLNVEPKANGISVVQMLKETTTLNVKETPTPTDDKEVRLRVVSPRIECGRVYIVEGSWNDDFLDEVCGFPSMPHDEFVDILGYAINDLYEDDDDIDYENLDKSSFGL